MDLLNSLKMIHFLWKKKNNPHPECSVPWDNAITYTVYLAYLALTPVLLAAPFGAKK